METIGSAAFCRRKNQHSDRKQSSVSQQLNHPSRCRTASNKHTPLATDTFKLSTVSLIDTGVFLFLIFVTECFSPSVGHSWANDMATFTKRTDASGNISWQVKIRHAGFPSHSQTFTSKALAQEWARQIEGEMDRSQQPINRKAERTTLADILTQYRDEVTPTHRGAAHERQRINQFLRHPISQYTMTNLSQSHIALWRNERMLTCAPGTVLREMSILSCAIERARAEWGLDLRESPLARVAKPKERPPRERRIDPTEEAQLYEGCERSRNPYLRPAIEFALVTAMRQGEIVSLEWRNVDLVKRTARLPITKNGRSRTVPLSTRAVAILESLPRTTELVFEGFSKSGIKHAFCRLTARLKIDDLHFHDLRHEAISRLVERGLNLMEVAAVSGHQTMQMLKRYTHLRAEDIALKLG